MIHDFTLRAARAVERYGYFLTILRSSADTVVRQGGVGMDRSRDEAVSSAQSAASSYLNSEQAEINDDTLKVAVRAYDQALSDLKLPEATIEDRFADFIYSAAYYVTRMLAAQAERDVMGMARHIQTTIQRIDLAVRSGRHSRSSAVAEAVSDPQVTAFLFVDRAGRRFKSSKHVQDVYRQHLLNTYNEVYMDVVASHGHQIVYVQHPEPDHKWQGQPLQIVSGADLDAPLYYDMRDEIFHPSTTALVTIRTPGD